MPSLQEQCAKQKGLRVSINAEMRRNARRVGRRMARFTEMELLEPEDKELMIGLFEHLPIPEIAKKFQTTPATVMLAIMGNL